MLNQLIDINNPKVLKVRDLKQHPKNPRKQNKEAMEFLEKSVEKLGSFRPLIINTKNEVLAGNQLLSILKKRKIEEIACLLPLKELTEEEEKAIIIADNQNSFYENSNKWDVDLVFNEFDLVLEEFKIDPVNFDLSLKEEVEEETDRGTNESPSKTLTFTFDVETAESLDKKLSRLQQDKNLLSKEQVLIALITNAS